MSFDFGRSERYTRSFHVYPNVTPGGKYLVEYPGGTTDFWDADLLWAWEIRVDEPLAVGDYVNRAVTYPAEGYDAFRYQVLAIDGDQAWIKRAISGHDSRIVKLSELRRSLS